MGWSGKVAESSPKVAESSGKVAEAQTDFFEKTEENKSQLQFGLDLTTKNTSNLFFPSFDILYDTG